MNHNQIKVCLYTSHLSGKPDNTTGDFIIGESGFSDIWNRICSFIKESFPDSAGCLTFHGYNKYDPKFLDLEISHGEPKGMPTRINGKMNFCAGIMTIHKQYVIHHESFETYDDSTYFIPHGDASELQSVSAEEAADFGRKACATYC